MAKRRSRKKKTRSLPKSDDLRFYKPIRRRVPAEPEIDFLSPVDEVQRSLSTSRVVTPKEEKRTRKKINVRLDPVKVLSETVGLDKHLICAKRKIRKEVLHALKKTGQGGQKKPEYNRDENNVRC